MELLTSTEPGNSDQTFNTISVVLEVIFILVFFMLLIVNFVVTIKYKIYENHSSLFITVSLMLLDALRCVTFIGTLFYEKKVLSSELIIRLGHDLPSFLFDCVTIALLFQFVQTYDVLSNHERAFENHSKRVYIIVEYTIVAVYVLFIVFDIVALAVDSLNQFQHPTLSEISEGLLCGMVTVIWIMYIALFAKFLHLFSRNKGAYDTIKWQVISFFGTVIALLTLRLALHWIFFADDYTQLVVILYRNGNSKKLFWVHIGQLFIILVESLFNILVLYNLINTVKN